MFCIYFESNYYLLKSFDYPWQDFLPPNKFWNGLLKVDVCWLRRCPWSLLGADSSGQAHTLASTPPSLTICTYSNASLCMPHSCYILFAYQLSNTALYFVIYLKQVSSTLSSVAENIKTNWAAFSTFPLDDQIELDGASVWPVEGKGWTICRLPSSKYA